MSSLTIPSSVKFIGEEAFYWCSELKDFEVLAVTPPTVYANSFDHDGYYRYKRIRLWVPYESQDEYKKHEVWGHFDTIGVIKTAIDENTIDGRDDALIKVIDGRIIAPAGSRVFNLSGFEIHDDTRVRDNFRTIPAVLISRDVQVMPPACCRRNSMP